MSGEAFKRNARIELKSSYTHYIPTDLETERRIHIVQYITKIQLNNKQSIKNQKIFSVYGVTTNPE